MLSNSVKLYSGVSVTIVNHPIFSHENIMPMPVIHAGAGTGSYSFIWAMGGENQAFDDMDVIPVTALR